MDQSEFKIHAYSGRENGLMIIGTAPALQRLSADLAAAVAGAPANSSPHWPAKLLEIDAESPYVDCADFKVSFHLQEAPLPARILVKTRSGPRVAVLVVVGVLSLVGAVSIGAGLWRAL